ncbi:MAG: cysteine--tRNA ligase [Robiginitomaculum sp.]|nr:cysteine--tRNA ligase [Robiginitomaculum sp.]
MELTLYNSLTRKKEAFKPADSKRVTMYNCGPTVYSYAHIGNARAAVVADVLFRVLRHIYGEDHVVYARNLTDIDDKIIKAAQELGVPIEEITEKYARIYNEDLAALNCLAPTMQPKATDHIEQMSDIIVELLDKEIAYISEGHVLFDVTKMKDYGKLSGRKLDDNLAGARVEVASYKKNAGDFVLWKPSKKDEPSWNPSNRFPPGRPGWHLECSAMIKEQLGDTIDIHLGGVDLKFPHHENEIAQSECANEKPLAKFWVHNEFLNMGKDKMSKSVGNVVLVHDLLKDWDGEVIRLALLKAHYRSELVWSDDLLKESKENLDHAYRYKFAAMEFQKINTGTLFGFDISLFNDLGTPEAFKDIIFHSGFVSQVVQRIDKGKDLSWADAKALDEYINSWNLLGLLQKDPEEWFRGKGKDGGLSDGEIEALILERTEVRAAKNWARADEIRDVFAEENIILEDGKDGTTWRRG